MNHAAKIRIISHTTKLFPIFFISNQKSAISHHSPPLCAPAPTAHKQSHIVHKTIAILLRKTTTSNPFRGGSLFASTGPAGQALSPPS